MGNRLPPTPAKVGRSLSTSSSVVARRPRRPPTGLPPTAQRSRKGRAAGGGSSDDRTAQDALQEKPKNMHNTMPLAACIVCSPTSTWVLRLITVCGHPSRRAHSVQVSECSTQQGCSRWWSDMAVGKWVSSALELVGLLSGEAALKEMSFTFGNLQPDSVGGIMEQRLADALLALVVELLATEVKDMSYYSSNMPGKVGGVIHEDSAMRDATLRYLHRVAIALEKLEFARGQSDALQEYWHNLSWPGQPWVREVLLGVMEGGGKGP